MGLQELECLKVWGMQRPTLTLTDGLAAQLMSPLRDLYSNSTYYPTDIFASAKHVCATGVAQCSPAREAESTYRCSTPPRDIYVVALSPSFLIFDFRVDSRPPPDPPRSGGLSSLIKSDPWGGCGGAADDRSMEVRGWGGSGGPHPGKRLSFKPKGDPP